MQSIPADRAAKRTFWQRQIAEFNGSKIFSAAQFCREQNLPYKSFMSWQSKLQGKPAVSAPQPKNFVQLEAPHTQSQTQPNMMTCKLPNGIEFTWDATTPASTISAVIKKVGQL